MRKSVIHISLLLLAAPLSAQERALDSVELSLEHRMLLRCSAAFATVAAGQELGSAQALAYPPMEDAGREFFVRSSAQVMDQANLDFDEVSDELRLEALALLDEGVLEQIMPVCLQLLEQSGL